MFYDQSTDLLIKNITMRLIGSCNNLALKHFFPLRKPAAARPEEFSGGFSSFSFEFMKPSEDRRDSSAFHCTAPFLIYTNCTNQTTAWTIKTSIRLPVCCHSSVKSWFFHRLPSYRCIWLIGPVSEISDHPLTLSLHSYLHLQSKCHDLAALSPYHTLLFDISSRVNQHFCFVLFYPDWIHRP